LVNPAPYGTDCQSQRFVKVPPPRFAGRGAAAVRYALLIGPGAPSLSAAARVEIDVSTRRQHWEFSPVMEADADTLPWPICIAPFPVNSDFNHAATPASTAYVDTSEVEHASAMLYRDSTGAGTKIPLPHADFRKTTHDLANADQVL